MRSLPFLFKEALVNLRRHGLMTVAAITTIAVALALVGSFLLTFYQINVATRHAVDDFEMRVFCKQSVTKAMIPRIRSSIAALPGVASVKYITKEQAFSEEMRNEPLDPGMPNVFPETFVVKMSDAQRAPAIAHKIGSWKDKIDEVSLPDDELRNVLNIARVLRNIGAVGGVILLLGALLVVSNTIRVSLFARRRELKIMQIVGASGWFIRLPLLLEGLLHGLMGGLLAAGLMVVIDHYVGVSVRQAVVVAGRYFQPVNMLLIGAGIVVAGILIGVFGSLISMRRYLKAA